MTVEEIVGRYYDAWKTKAGDMSEVPLAEDLVFRGPVASFEDAEGFRALAREAGGMVTKFDIRHQFVDGNRVCSVVDFEATLCDSPVTSAEILEIADGKIVRGEVIYDAEKIRAAMAAR